MRHASRSVLRRLRDSGASGSRAVALAAATAAVLLVSATIAGQEQRRIGLESVVSTHLKDGDEFTMPVAALIGYGKILFSANWTDEDGAGRPLSKGTGEPLSDPTRPLRGARAFNRVSGPDANSCRGCHNAPYGMPGGNGDFVTVSIALADRFDFVSFDRRDPAETSLSAVGNARSTPGLSGAGYIEMLARQMSQELQRTRDSLQPGQSKPLVTNGISFGTIALGRDRTWNTEGVEGLPPQSLQTSTSPRPSLIIRPWRQSASVVSLRELTNTAYNQHLGIQTTERFGAGADPDGDGIVDEMTVADVTAVVLFEATLPVPGRVIPNDPDVERAIAAGERVFDRIGCTTCHVPSLRLSRKSSIYSEPGPYNSAGNLRRGGRARVVQVDLKSAALPQPRLVPSGVESGIDVPAYTDFKLHDITDPADPHAAEPLDMNQPAGSRQGAQGNRRFLTRRLWGVGNQSPYFHHGLFTTIRRAVLSHAGEALGQRTAFERLVPYEQDALIEFLKSMQVLPPSSKALVVDEHGEPKVWPRAGLIQ